MATAIVSPKALPKPSRTAEKIPGPAAFNNVYFIVSHFVAPSERDDSLNSMGTDFSDSIHRFMIMGNTITDNTILAVNIHIPVVLIPSIGPIIRETNGTRTSSALNPKTTEGIPARMSINDDILSANLSCRYSLIYIEDSKDTGTAKSIEIAVTVNVPTIAGRNPNLYLSGFQSEENSNSFRENREITMDDFAINMYSIMRNKEEINMENISINLLLDFSFIILM